MPEWSSKSGATHCNVTIGTKNTWYHVDLPTDRNVHSLRLKCSAATQFNVNYSITPSTHTLYWPVAKSTEYSEDGLWARGDEFVYVNIPSTTGTIYGLAFYG